MKYMAALLACVLLTGTAVSAHTLERNNIIRSDGEINIQFSTEPEFPLTGQTIHFDFIPWDNDGKILYGLDLIIEIRKGSKITNATATETGEGHYGVEFETEEFGEYRLSPYIKGEKVDISFEVYIDAFGPQGWISVGIIALLLIILIALMYNDCRGKNIERGSTG